MSLSRRLIFILLGIAAMAPAAERLPEPVRQASAATWQQCSTGIIEVWGFIDVGRAAIWLPDCSRLDWPMEPPVLLRFGYDREVPGDAFARSALAMLERNLDTDTFRRLQPRIKAFNRNYRDTRKGDTYSMLWQPDGTLTLWLNDRQLASESGELFARNYLKIWFGPAPYSEKLKRALLTPAS